MQKRDTTTTGGLLSLRDVADHLGISERHVQNLRFRRLIPAIKLSERCLRFRLSDVERALEKLTIREIQ